MPTTIIVRIRGALMIDLDGFFCGFYCLRSGEEDLGAGGGLVEVVRVYCFMPMWCFGCLSAIQ